jgi:hypothetical protein
MPVACVNIPAGSGSELATATLSCSSAVVTCRSGRQLATAVSPTRGTVEVMIASLQQCRGSRRE